MRSSVFIFFLLGWLLAVSLPQSLSAQEDSVRLVPGGVRLLPEGYGLPGSSSSMFDFSLPERPMPLHSPLLDRKPAAVPRFSLNTGPVLPYYTDPSPRFHGDFQTGGPILRTDGGLFYGMGGQTSLPGLGLLNNASLGYAQTFNDRWSMQVQMNAMKVNFSRMTGQAFDFSGMLMYRVTDRLAFRAFGTYAPGNTYGMTTHRYGATMKLDMTDRFGMEMGAQRYYDAMRGGWQTVPIVIPYYKFNEKFTLGLDVGGLLFEVLRGVIEKHRGVQGGPTIMPPDFHAFPGR